MDSKTFYEKLAKETVYLAYEFEDCVLKSLPGGGTFVKFKGANEFRAHPDSKIVAEALLERKIITKAQYDNYS